MHSKEVVIHPLCVEKQIPFHILNLPRNPCEILYILREDSSHFACTKKKKKT